MEIDDTIEVFRVETGAMEVSSATTSGSSLQNLDHVDQYYLPVCFCAVLELQRVDQINAPDSGLKLSTWT